MRSTLLSTLLPWPTVQIASRAQMPNYTTMVQHFLGTLQLPIAILHVGLLPPNA